MDNDAVKMFMKSYTIDPNQPEACKLMGKSLNSLKRYKEAKDWLKKAINMNEESEEVFSEMGYACQNTDEPTEALAWYKKAQAIEKDCSLTL